MKVSLQKPPRGSRNPTWLGATERKTKWTFFLCSEAFLCRCVFLLINKSGQRGKGLLTHTHSHSATVCFQAGETTMKNKNTQPHLPSSGASLLRVPTAGTEASRSPYTSHPGFPSDRDSLLMSSDSPRQGRSWGTPASLPGEDPRRPLCTTPHLAALCSLSLWMSGVGCSRCLQMLSHAEVQCASRCLPPTGPRRPGWSRAEQGPFLMQQHVPAIALMPLLSLLSRF